MEIAKFHTPARKVVLVTAMDGSAHLAAALSEGADVVVEVVRSRRAALALLRREQPAVVLMDTALPNTETTPMEMVWQNAEGSVPLEVNVRVMGARGLIRLLKNVLDHWGSITTTVRQEVAQSMAEELRTTVTGMLLQGDLALRDESIPPAAREKVRAMRAMADTLRMRLLIR